MKKYLLPLPIITFLSSATNVFAEITPRVTIKLEPPPGTGINPDISQVPDIFSSLVTLVFVIAALLVLIMLIWGAFQWITSAGDKEKVGAARGRIINALIGLALIALAFLIVRLVGTFFNIDILRIPIGPIAQPPPGTSSIR